jgi:hypothetical protein
VFALYRGNNKQEIHCERKGEFGRPKRKWDGAHAHHQGKDGPTDETFYPQAIK